MMVYKKEVFYGTEAMPSKNLKGKVWIEYDEDGVTVKNPYKLLPAVATYIAMVFVWEYFYHMCNKKKSSVTEDFCRHDSYAATLSLSSLR